MFGFSEAWVILLIAVLLFGGNQIPKLARALGRARKDFQEGIKEGEREFEAEKKAEEIPEKKD